jgi:hypothetical protein
MRSKLLAVRSRPPGRRRRVRGLLAEHADLSARLAPPAPRGCARYNAVMSIAVHIRCPACGSYRVTRRPAPRANWLVRLLNWAPGPHFLSDNSRPKPGTHECRACGHVFEVHDVETYSREHPITQDRCIRCDQIALELIARDINPTDSLDPAARADIYRCAACGCESQWCTRDVAGALY